MAVTLRELTKDNYREVLKLEPAPDQQRFVARNVWSIADATFHGKAWYRGIYADDTPVGFAMLHTDPGGEGYWVWRLMIAGDRQGHGYGREAVRLLVAQVRAWGAEELKLSYVPGEGSPEGFYRSLGFAPTGEVEEGEIVLRLAL
ncbi:MAG: GNAT family N-acetyltransferase [Deltaproteobacteria bacterium]|nr:MAG: GNAT family N-acetyltransferase [Deltaproteobacteria bacterium]